MAIALVLSGGGSSIEGTASTTQASSGVDESRIAASISSDAGTSTDDAAAAEMRSDPHGTAIALRSS
ncbi:MAG: hypothetical protein H0T69_01650 [Thermoleophilaceae bacterium]|nr:hypothetical protein [Thermoleophilaceae bacterium]